ncbi:MAG: hypothetical protein LBV27_00910, partial [Oscillospiraceae bacterium]|nr:hypothetical protein [Oscillospiraceae bacterium]
IQDKNRKKMAKAMEKNFYPQEKVEAEPVQPVSPSEEANNLLLLQKLAADPKVLQTLMAILGGK